VVFGVLGAAAIALAVLMGLTQVLLPLAAHYPRRVAAMLSARLDRPVSFTGIEGHWQPSGPLLVLHQVRIGGDARSPGLALPSAEVKMDFGALLWPSRHWINLRLRGLHLELVRDADGAWHAAGFGSGTASGARVALDRLPGNLWLSGLRLDIADARSGRHYAVLADSLRLSNDGRNIRFAGLVRRPQMPQTLHVAGRFRADGGQGRIYLGGTGIDLGRLLDDVAIGGRAVDGGHGDFALWLDWRDARLAGGTARLDLDALALHGPDGDIAVPALHGLFQYAHDAGGTRVLYAGTAQGIARVDIAPDGTVAAGASDLEVAHLLPLLAMAPQLPPGLGQWLAAAHPRGHVQQASVRWAPGHGLQSLSAQFDGLGFDAVAARPGVDALRGVLRGDGEAVALELPPQATTLALPRVFRQPFALSSLAGTLVAWRAGATWHFDTDAVHFVGKEFSGEVRGDVAVADGPGKPVLDLYAGIDAAVPAATRLLPVHAMAPSAVEWLDRALLGGTLHGDAVLHGDVADWPFRNHLGRFEARGVLHDLALDFDPRWPHAEGIDAVASFVDNGMLVEASAGQSSGVRIDTAVGSIADFGAGDLALAVHGNGSGASVLDLLRKSPIGAAHASALQGLTLGGRADFGFDLVLPLKHDAATTLAGQATLHGADAADPAWGLQLAALDGPLTFDAHGFRASQLDAVFRGTPAKLDLAVGAAAAAADPGSQVSAQLRGRFSVAQLIQGHDELKPLLDIGRGSADFTLGYELAVAPQPSVATTQVLSIDSDLRGMQLDLPAPLRKEAAAALPLHMQLDLPAAGHELRLALGDVLQARARLPQGTARPLAANIVLGGAMPATVPAAGIHISGHAAMLDVSEWARRALAGTGDGGMPPLTADVDTDGANLFGKHFQHLHLQLQPGAQETVLGIDGAQIKGSLELPATELDRRGITARFDRLYWPGEPDRAADTATSPATAASAPAPPAYSAAVAADTGIDPAGLPPLHLWVGDLRFGDAHLGDARFESFPTAQGMHIDQLRTHSPSVHIGASGDWNGTAAASHTHMVIDFGAESLGRMLDAFGFDGLFTGGQTRAHLDATWPGAPFGFALANIDGTLAVDIGKGRIPEVRPGMGRLFGLMSVAELPRRLSLDFGDVFGKGFGFDSIKGHFRFADGNAFTDDLAVKGSAADISVKGRTGLRARDYDQQVYVVPHIGNSLPVVGAVVAGPVGAAAGLAVQGLLGKGLNKAASARYRISGSWDKPDITLIEKNVPSPPPPAPATSTPPPPGGV
jgi:uncharacterized protein (TIGR02099 family)